MPASFRHEMELPIYPEDSVLTEVRHLQGPQPVNTFTPHTILRTVRGTLGTNRDESSAISPVPATLTELLTRTDEQLELIAALCKTRVVAHKWGLLEDPNSRQNRLSDNLKELVPKDYSLVSEVDIIKDAVDFRSRNIHKLLLRRQLGSVTLWRGLAKYYWEPEGYYIWDTTPRQFVTGTPSGSDDKRPHTWLVDIEPRLRYRSHSLEQNTNMDSTMDAGYEDWQWPEIER